MSPAFLALMGAIAGGAPQLILPTATALELIGNTLMGAAVVAMLDVLLMRKTLAGRNLRKGRMLAIVVVAFTLTTVTYRSPSRVFQTIFDYAPPAGKVANLTARAYTAGPPYHLGHLGYDLAFSTDPVTLHNVREPLDKLAAADFDPHQEPWPAFLARTLPPNSPLLPPAAAFTDPEGSTWSTTRDGRTAGTVLLHDRKSGMVLVHHVSG